MLDFFLIIYAFILTSLYFFKSRLKKDNKINSVDGTLVVITDEEETYMFLELNEENGVINGKEYIRLYVKRKSQK